jgi:hypothetical protein
VYRPGRPVCDASLTGPSSQVVYRLRVPTLDAVPVAALVVLLVTAYPHHPRRAPSSPWA